MTATVDITTDNATATAAVTAAPEVSWKHVLPLRISSKVVRGFGRGATDLGIPTANLCAQSATIVQPSFLSGDEKKQAEGDAISTAQTTETVKEISSFDDLPCGIYWGFCRVGSKSSQDASASSSSSADSNSTSNPLGRTYITAVSIGYNPTYGNDTKTVEPHLIASEDDPCRHRSNCGETLLPDLYDHPVKLSVLGYLRPELPFEGLDKLIQAIKGDIIQSVQLARQASDLNDMEQEWVDKDD